MVNLETTLESVIPTVPDLAGRQHELATLLDLARRERLEEPSALGPWQLVEGSGLLFSAPHEVTHRRDGVEKVAETGTGALAMALAGYTDGSAIATAGIQTGDPNWDPGHPFVTRAADLDATIAAIDIHMMQPRGIELCIGLGPSPQRAEGLWAVLAEEAVAAGIRFAVNWPFGANAKTVTGQLQRLGRQAVQIELSWECFDQSHPAHLRTWSAVARAARRIAGGDVLRRPKDEPKHRA